MTTPTPLSFEAVSPTEIRTWSVLEQLAVAEASEAATSWIQVAVTGDFVSTRYGEFSITRADLTNMQANFAEGRFPVPPTKLPVDYNHTSMKANPTAVEGEAAGWFVSLELRGDGEELWALVEWTDKAAEAVRTKAYQFVSPSIARDYTANDGTNLGTTLISSAVTNLPFLQGMEPLALSAAAAGVLGDRHVTRVAPTVRHFAEFSFDERRARLREALMDILGDPDDVPYERSWCVIDVFDDVVIYNQGEKRYRIGYTIDDNGSVTLDGPAVEVVVNYEPLDLGGRRGETHMPLIKLTNSEGTEVEVDEEALEQSPYVQALRAKIPAEGSVVLTADQHQELTGKAGQSETLGTQVQSLTTDLKTLQDERKKEKADAAVKQLLDDRKIRSADREHYLEMATDMPEFFEKHCATLTATAPERDKVHGTSSATPAATSGEQRLEELAAEIWTANPKLTKEQAYVQALDREPQALASSITQ